jgi:HTH-type transcriptional regulator / antitoxin HigA
MRRRYVRVRPIRTEADYEAALGEINALMDAMPGTLEGDRLDVLATLVEAYEEKHYPIEPPDPVEAIKLHMEQSGTTNADLGRLIGSVARAREVLARRKPLTLAMIRRLRDEWHIPADSLIGAAPATKPAAAKRAAAASRTFTRRR